MNTNLNAQLQFYYKFYSNFLRKEKKFFLLFYIISRTLLQIIDLFGIGLLVYSINDLLLDNNIYKYYLQLFSSSYESTDFYLKYFTFLMFAFAIKYIFQTILNFKEKLFFSDVLINIHDSALDSIIKEDYLSTKEKKFSHISDGFVLNLKTFVENYFKTISDSFSDLIFIVSSIFIFIVYNYKVTLILFIFNLLVIFPLIKIIKNRNIKNGVIYTEYQPKIFTLFSDLYNNVEFLKLYGYVNVFKSRLLDSLKISITSDRKRKFLNDLIKPIIEFVLFTIIIMTILALISYDSNYRNTINDLIVIIVASLRVLPFLLKLSQTVSSLSYYSINAKKTFSDLNLFKTYTSINETIKDFEYIKLVNIYYKINNNSILQNFNYTINKFDKLFVEGPTGSGKSTFLKIIIGIIEPNKGSILINGYSKKNYKFLRLGYVDQNPIIFNENFLFNITFNNNYDHINKDKFNKIIDICELTNVIKMTDNNEQLNFDKFSGGEKQRIGLARALYNCDKLLVLDESTSAIDLKTSKKIITKIISHFDQLTIIMVSHQDSLKYLFTKILRIKN